MKTMETVKILPKDAFLLAPTLFALLLMSKGVLLGRRPKANREITGNGCRKRSFSMKSQFLLVAIALFIAICSPIAAAGISPEQIKANLDKIPAADPVVTNPPQLIDAMKGVHPRLLFTTKEIAALKKQISGDPLLKKAYEGTIAWANITQVPSGPKPPIVMDDGSALVKSYSQAPAMAYAYALDRSPAIKKKIEDTLTTMLNQPYWAAVQELDSSMGGACNMMMVALLYDAIYTDLNPTLRSQMAAKILLHARRLYYLGHKELSIMPYRYWTNDPQPNHRWYRDMGLAACLLAVADEKDLNTGYLLQGLKDEMDFIIKWYPLDGDCHEGAGYQSFGYTAIATACAMMDRNLGTDYLNKSGLKNAWAQQIYYWVPGRLSDISWGDDQNSPSANYGHNDASFFLGPQLSRDKQAQAMLLMRLSKNSVPDKKGKKPLLPWTMLTFYDPTVGQGDYKALIPYRLFPDMGAASMRDSWEDDAVVFTFKCGPVGGYKLNEYRMATLENGKPHSINIAHDDADANEFALAVGNGFAFHPGVYTTSPRGTTEHSTLTVDNIGQINEFPWWTPPLDTADFRQFANLTGWKSDAKGHVIIEGEAGSAYRGKPEKNPGLPEPLLKTFRRTAIWMPGEYILILDNIVANGIHTITWHGTAPKAQVAKLPWKVTTEAGHDMNIQVLTNHEVQSSVVDQILNGRWGNVPVQQLQLTLKTDAVKFATILDPWKKKPEMKMSEAGGIVTLSVRSKNFDDTWIWQAAKDAATPSRIEGKRGGESLICLTEADKAPTQ